MRGFGFHGVGSFLSIEALGSFLARRGFYKCAFEDDAQNSINDYLVEFSIEANEAALKRYLGVTKLSDEHVFEAAHFAYGNIGCVIS